MMKNKYFLPLLTLFFLFIGISVHAQQNEQSIDDTESVTDGPMMTFESMVVDYGSIVQNSEPLRVLKFTNTGTEPLVIQNARGSCGCTVPSFPKQPIMPGETSQIEIRYDTKRVGKINKTVMITTNEGGQPHMVKVVGNISKPSEDEGVPPSKNSLIKPGKNK